MKLKEKYYDRINKREIEINVNAKVAHFLKQERDKNRILSPEEIARLSKKKRQEYLQRSFERKQESLDQLMYDGFQPSEEDTIEDELCRRYRERKYLASKEYKEFRLQLKKEIRKVLDKMPEQVKKSMYLRFFKDMSIAQIASQLHIQRGAAQSYLSRGTGYIKYFLDKDKERRMRIAQMREQRHKR